MSGAQTLRHFTPGEHGADRRNGAGGVERRGMHFHLLRSTSSGAEVVLGVVDEGFNDHNHRQVC